MIYLLIIKRIVADEKYTFEITGQGDVLEPYGGVVSIGSGSGFATGIILFLKHFL